MKMRATIILDFELPENEHYGSDPYRAAQVAQEEGDKAVVEFVADKTTVTAAHLKVEAR